VPKDSFNREIDYLRMSITDRCNLRCVYCMPLEGLRFLPNAELIQPAEYEMVARAAVSVGFHKFRLTGGEPLLRLDIVEIVERLTRVPGVTGLALTTNALLLPELAEPLKRRGWAVSMCISTASIPRPSNARCDGAPSTKSGRASWRPKPRA